MVEAPKGGGPEGWEAQNFELFFFSSSCLKLHSLCAPWASSRGISVEFEVLGPSKMHVWSQNVHFGWPRPSKTPPKFNEKTP